MAGFTQIPGCGQENDNRTSFASKQKNRCGRVLEAIKLIQLFKDVKILGRNQQDLHLQNSTGKVLTT